MHLMRIVIFYLTLILSSACLAAEPETYLYIEGEITSGQQAEFSLFLFNAGDGPVNARLPDKLTCIVRSDGQEIEVAAHGLSVLSQGPAEIGAGMFMKKQYSFDVPEKLEGPVKMKILEIEAPEVMFSITSSYDGNEAVARQGELEAKKPGSTIDELFSLYQPYQVNFAAYEPVYFLVGANPEESKFQISFKYQVFKEENYLALKHPWVKGFNLGYTQTSFWDIKTTSAPFKDTSYKPEIFYISSNIDVRPDWMKVFLINAGFRHESNGQGGDLSRSTNMFYIRPIFVFYRENGRYGLIVAPRLRSYFKNSSISNPDLPDYRGYFDLDVKLGKAENFVIGSNMAIAKRGASFQFDLTYPLNNYIFKDLNLFLHVQYVNALAESLIDYSKRNKALRIGFALIR